MNELQKHLKLVSQKSSTLQFLNPSELGFQVQKLIVKLIVQEQQEQTIVNWSSKYISQLLYVIKDGQLAKY